MRKLALGLNSIPSGNVPGSENVEVPNLNEEDIESANKTGFNAIEQSGFDEEEGLDKAVIAYNKVFDYRLGNKMRNELIKLNKALNGIGYKNLIKIAASEKKEDPCNLKDKLEGQVKDLIWAEVIKLTEIEKDKYRPLYIDIFSSIIYDKADFTAEKLHNIFKNHVPGSVTPSFIDYLYRKLDVYLVVYKTAADNCELVETNKNRSTSIPAPSTSAAPSTPTPPAASTAPIVKAIPIKPPGEDTIDEYSGKTYKSKNPGDNWYYKIIGPLEVDVSKDNINFKKLKPGTMGVSKWNRFATAIRGYMSDNQLEQITTNVSPKTPEVPVTPASTPTPAETPIATTPTGAAQSSTGGLVTETINGEQVVSIGTHRGSQIFLVVDSVRQGTPQFYIKYGEKVSPLGKDDGRLREFLGRLEVRRIANTLESTKLFRPQQIEGFKDFMNLQRMQNRNPLFRKRRGEDIEDAKKQMTSAAREERLDRLKKKGVI